MSTREIGSSATNQTYATNFEVGNQTQDYLTAKEAQRNAVNVAKTLIYTTSEMKLKST